MSETDVAVMDTPQGAPASEAAPGPKQSRKTRRKPRGAVPGPDTTGAAGDESDADAGDGPVEDAHVIAPSIEAILITMDKPIPATQLAEALGLGGTGARRRVQGAVDLLNEQYERSGRTFRIESVASGYRVMTRPEFASAISAIHGVRESQRLTKAGIETLAIVAYRQPITRAEIEAIRGVACGDVLRTLLERRMIAIVGRAEELGRPMLYGTSKRFLEVFGFSSVKDLPAISEVFPGVEAPPMKKRAMTPVGSDDAGDQDGGGPGGTP